MADPLLYFAGTNNYYLHYQAEAMIDEVLQNARTMELAVIRMWGFLDGQAANGFALQTEPGVYPEDGYARFDYTVWQAGKLGLKLVVVLVNNWNDFGGMQQYLTWFGSTDHDDFFRDPQIKLAYKEYIRHFLQRENRYTGCRVLDEPAILAWELANEPRCPSDPSGETLFQWVRELSAFIKDLDHSHLVAIGDEGWYNRPNHPDWAYNGSQGLDWTRTLALPTLDYATFHLYPDHWKKDHAWSLQWIADHIQSAHELGKPVVLEEFGWLDLTTRNEIYTSWTNAFSQLGGRGTQFWILTGHQPDGTLYPDHDGFRVTYPSQTASHLAAHATSMHSKNAAF